MNLGDSQAASLGKLLSRLLFFSPDLNDPRGHLVNKSFSSPLQVQYNGEKSLSLASEETLKKNVVFLRAFLDLKDREE